MSKSRTEDTPEALFLTVDEAATRLRQSSKTVRRRIASGEIVAHRFGRALRISSHDLSIYIKTSRR
jgi:excisionase family DNA binding protein